MASQQNDEIFDTEEDTEDYVLYLCSCSRTGGETLNMSTPGDYEYDADTFEDPDYEIVEVWNQLRYTMPLISYY